MMGRSAGLRRAVVCGLLLAALASCGADNEEPDFDRLLAEGVALYSHNKQELIIRHFFRDRREGTFLDVGCFHAIKHSTTYYLEKHLGWSGIGVDAQEWLRSEWRESRPRSKFVSAVVADKAGETVTFFQLGGISALDRENITRRDREGKKKQMVEVQLVTSTLDDLLRREGVEEIDFLSMDINGAEPAALAGFDIQRFRPELVLVEVHKKNRELLTDYFERNGYERIDDYLPHDTWGNWYFRPRR